MLKLRTQIRSYLFLCRALALLFSKWCGSHFCEWTFYVEQYLLFNSTKKRDGSFITRETLICRLEWSSFKVCWSYSFPHWIGETSFVYFTFSSLDKEAVSKLGLLSKFLPWLTSIDTIDWSESSRIAPLSPCDCLESWQVPSVGSCAERIHQWIPHAIWYSFPRWSVKNGNVPLQNRT